jgi:hypothetical protein
MFCGFFTRELTKQADGKGLKKNPRHFKKTRRYNTVKRVDEVVQHPHLVTQDQFTQVSKKVSDIPKENFTINIKLFRRFSQVSN